MSRYIDWKDVTNKYASAARGGGASEQNEPYLVAAEDEVDAWLAPYYTVPFTPCPGTVKDICVDIAYYKLNVRGKDAKPLWDYIERRLKAIQTGAMLLTVSGSVIERAGSPRAFRVAMVSSGPPIGGYSVETPCFMESPQS